MLLGYARVSTADQNLDAQVQALTAAGVDPARIFSDKASGAKADRPGLEELFRNLRPGDVIVIARLDRLGRSLPELIAMVKHIEESGAGLRSLSETIDTTTPTGKLLFHMFAALAEFERGLIQERTLAGLAAARKRGAKAGRPPILTGTKRAAIQTLWSQPDVAVEDIATDFGVSRRTLYREFGPRFSEATAKA